MTAAPDALPLPRGVPIVVAIVCVGHLVFALRDGRLPPDLGLFFGALPAAWDAPRAELLLHTGGWYDLLLVGLFRVLGVGPVPFALLGLVWVGGIVAAAGRLGGLGAAALVGAMPAVWVQGRVGWIHVPEAALLLTAAVWARRDPGLRGRASLAGLAGVGALAALLRPSAVAWLLVLAVWLARAAGRRAVPVLVAWALAALPAAVEGQAYLTAKLEARSRYEVDVPDLLHQVPLTLGTVPAVVVGVGLVVGALRPRALDRLLLAWSLVPVALFVVFRAGVDNFTVGAASLGILAGAGLARLGPAGTLGPLAALVLSVAAQWVPTAGPDTVFGRAAGLLGLPVGDNLKNHARVHHAWTRADVAALVEGSCAVSPCTIGVVQGLFRPHGEDPGRFELFLAGLPGVFLADLRDAPGPVNGLAAVVTWDCPDGDPAWFRRWPGALPAARAAIATRGFTQAWQRQVDPGCRVTWWAPPTARLPESDPRVPTLFDPDPNAPPPPPAATPPPPEDGPRTRRRPQGRFGGAP